MVTEQPRWVAISRKLWPCSMCAITGRWNEEDLTPAFHNPRQAPASPVPGLSIAAGVDTSGFHDGWGAALDQLVEMVKGRAVA